MQICLLLASGSIFREIYFQETITPGVGSGQQDASVTEATWEAFWVALGHAARSHRGMMMIIMLQVCRCHGVDG